MTTSDTDGHPPQLVSVPLVQAVGGHTRTVQRSRGHQTDDEADEPNEHHGPDALTNQSIGLLPEEEA